MTDTPSYVIVGRGRWARRMRGIIESERRRTVYIEEVRQLSLEQETAYRSRLASAFADSRSQIAWLCLPPGSHIPTIMEAAMESGLHVIAEKPWLCSPADTQRLQTIADSKHLLLGMHYEYCLLDAVEAWGRDLDSGVALRFGGRLNISRPDHLGLSALDNLGTHLFAIRAHAVPKSEVSEIDCGYERPDERCVWLEHDDNRVAFIDILASKEPIIQRFMAGFESALAGAPFHFGLDFALRVAEEVAAWKKKSAWQSPAP